MSSDRPDHNADEEFWRDVAAAQAAGLDPTLERKPLELKGKHLVTEVVSLRVDGPA